MYDTHDTHDTQHATVRALVKHYYEHAKLAAICAAPTALKAAGVGRGIQATSYPSFKSELAGYFDYSEASVVVDGQVVTSRGPGTAIQFALAIVGRLVGPDVAKKVASGMLV